MPPPPSPSPNRYHSPLALQKTEDDKTDYRLIQVKSIAYSQILEILYVCIIYSKTCLQWSLQKKTKIGFQDRLSLNAGQKGSILQYFLPSLSYHLSLRSLFCQLLSGRLRQVLLYVNRERSGSVVECLTQDGRAVGSSLTVVTALWSLSKTHLS